MSKVSPVIDSKTALTMNDICRLLKGMLREQNVGGALYCLAVLERAQCFAIARRLIVAALFETGAAIDFAYVLPTFVGVADNDFAALRTQAKMLCSRGENFYHMVPDMLARVTGLNDESTLYANENIDYPRVMSLINAVRRDFAERHEDILDAPPDPTARGTQRPVPATEHGFFIQTAFALIGNLHASLTFDHTTIWRAARLQRLLVLGGYGADLWRLYAALPDAYGHWNNGETRTFLRCIAALCPLLSASYELPTWDKQRLAHVTVAIGLLFPFNVDARLSGGVGESPAVQLPLPLPPWFYATQAAPPASAAVIVRAGRPSSVDRYVAMRYGKMAATWDPMRAELLTLMAKAGGMSGVPNDARSSSFVGHPPKTKTAAVKVEAVKVELAGKEGKVEAVESPPTYADRPCCSMAVQSSKFRPRLASARVLTPPALKDRPVAICPHVFFTEPAANSSSICAFNPSLVTVHLAPPHLAVLYPSSMLQPNSEFMRACERHLIADREKRGLRILIGGPFIEVENIARVVAYHAVWRALGLFDDDARLEPFLLLQPSDRTLVTVLLHAEWVPVAADNDARRFVWAMEWIVRFMLRMDSTYRACDFVSPEDRPNALFACLAAYSPSYAWDESCAAVHEAACVNQLGADGCAAEMVDGAVDLIEETFAGGAFETAVNAGPPALAAVYRSIVIQSVPHYTAQLAALRAALKIARTGVLAAGDSH